MMQIDKLENFSKKIKGKLVFNYDLKKSNWFNIGGKTKAYFKPESLNELVSFLREFGKSEKFFILGAGSNILINDKIFNGVVIKLGKNFSNIALLPNKTIVAGSATTDKNLSAFASVLAKIIKGTPITSAASLADFKFLIIVCVGTKTLPPICPHFFSDAN